MAFIFHYILKCNNIKTHQLITHKKKLITIANKKKEIKDIKEITNNT